MAQGFLETTKLRLVFQTGMDDEGKPIIRSKTFSNVTKAATADQLYQAANALAGLTIDQLNKVERNDSSEIIG
ncbi:DUF1659 domain-containing protein [Neobacillus dielmonensis]|uniref:DUF1659 domain-containing protein n=1 Tax=Neobacillus dielmonensis TaxID=1347369 RepID=UPI0005A98BEB|nr:DUF1659 domain-containing protein [Neobacillus dielmonensis]